MKKILLLIVISLLIFITPSFAQEMIPVASVTPVALPTPTPEYKLPYPGMLPDSPLYKLKVLRDKIEELLIADPDKKVQFYLLLADKQMAMVPLLVDKHEVSLAEKTALKAEDNYTKITYVYKAMGQKPSQETLSKLLMAAQKHQSVLMTVEKKVSATESQVFTQVENFSVTNTKELQKIFTGE